MRQIKFRAWDKTNNKFHYDKIAVSNDGVIQLVENTSDVWRYTDFIPQQYLERKDKNGKELYEGDIVDIDDFRDNILYVAEWDNKNNYRFSYGFYDYDGQYYNYPICIFDTEHRVTIVGNIYENPELIKRNKQETEEK